MSPSDLAAVTGMKGENVRFLLFKMAPAGEVVRVGRGRYAHPLSTPANNANVASNAYRAARDGEDDDVKR
jgi:hypothetical protein